jgi:hypothetical protein
MRCENTFELLNDLVLTKECDLGSEVAPAEDVSLVERSLGEQAVFGTVDDVAKVVHKCCNCGKTLKLKNVDSKCAKCANVSFSNLPDQLVTEDVVSHVFVPVVNVSDDVSNCEVVPLKVFARAGKRGHYESYGLCFIDSESSV